MTDQTLEFDRELLRRYDVRGPRYTSYPTAIEFSGRVDAAAYRDAVAASNEDPIPRALSLYVHVPYCRTVCFYCACNRIITANRARADAYLKRVADESARQAALFDTDREVVQLHLGGGTPTYLDNAQLSELMAILRQAFPLTTAADREFAIEIDPRTADAGTIAHLAALGFNRMSLGVQDFDPAVQAAVNRIQSVAETEAVLTAARAHGFHSTNLDLIYGLPRQTRAGFERTLETVIALRPERLALYSYAHLPDRFRVQRQIDASELPDAATKLALLETAIARLTAAGYVYIGMDHFALPDDELAVAQQQGTLHRNFQGYATRAGLDLVGLGPSAIGHVGDTYVQNAADEATYNAAVDADELPIARGVVADADDRLRATVISAIMCAHRVDYARVERSHRIIFRQYFANELARLAPLEADGLVRRDAGGFSVTPRGRLLLRNVAMIFDAYRSTPGTAGVTRFSRAL